MQEKGVEPPSGQTGPGTAEKPYDQGNQLENNGVDSPSKAKTPENAAKPNNTPSIIDQLSRTKTKEEIANQKKAKAQGLDKAKANDEPAAEPAAEPARGRDQSQSAATAATPATVATSATPASTKPKHPDDERPSMALAPKSTRVQERSMSPGTLPDGSHVKCSGEKGESYTPPTGLGKLAGKIRSAAH